MSAIFSCRRAAIRATSTVVTSGVSLSHTARASLCLGRCLSASVAPRPTQLPTLNAWCPVRLFHSRKGIAHDCSPLLLLSYRPLNELADLSPSLSVWLDCVMPAAVTCKRYSIVYSVVKVLPRLSLSTSGLYNPHRTGVLSVNRSCRRRIVALRSDKGEHSGWETPPSRTRDSRRSRGSIAAEAITTPYTAKMA